MVRLQDHVLISVLDRAVVRPQHRSRRHVGIELLRHPDADRDLDLRVLRLDLRPRRDEVLPGGRAVGLPDLRPDALQVIAGIGDIVVAEAEPFPRHRIVGAALAQVDERPVPSHGLLHDVGHVEHLRLERPRRRQELKEVVALLRRDFRVGPRRQIGKRDVVHRDLDALGHAPVLGVLVEPRVVGGNEVAPLDDFERLLLPFDPERRALPQGRRHGRCPRRPDELPPIHPLSLGHGTIP